MKKDVFICDCNSTDHQIIVYLDEYDGQKIVYFHVKLNKYGFWKRIKRGIPYIFGHTSRYGDFDEFIFNPEDAKKLRLIADFLER